MLRAKEVADFTRGELLQYHICHVDELLTSLRAGIANGMDWTVRPLPRWFDAATWQAARMSMVSTWQVLSDLVTDSARQGDGVAAMVHELDFANHAVTIVLPADDDDDAGEEAVTQPAVPIKLDIRLSAAANARNFYANKKAAAAKTARTVEAAESAVKSAEKRAKASVASIKLTASIRAVRSAMWFEKFAWFVTSENFLVLGGSDPHQVALVVV